MFPKSHPHKGIFSFFSGHNIYVLINGGLWRPPFIWLAPQLIVYEVLAVDSDDKPSKSATLLRAITQFITQAVPVLDASRHGWWRLILIAAFLWGSVSALNITARLDPQKIYDGMKRPQDDCGVKDGRFIDKGGDCW
jgi:hypothetical protein